MIKSIFNYFFSNNTKQVNQNEVKKNTPEFAIFENGPENGPMKNDYEITEISYEEFTKSVTQERRKTPRGNDGVRST